MSSKIPWTEETWNPVVGCTKCSPGYLNCYAETMAYRLRCAGIEGYADDKGKTNGVVSQFGLWRDNIRLIDSKLDKPLHWRKPRRIFPGSMSDLFHPAVEIGFLTHIFDTIEQCPQHTFQILTKRPKQALKMMWGRHDGGWRYFGKGDYHKNIWFGTSVCTPDEKWKLETLSRIPAAVRFVSFEPLLADMGEILLTSNREDDTDLEEFGQHIDWVIIGAESINGQWPGRECKLEWIDSIIEQCKAANVPVFVKQIHRDGKLVKMPTEYPQDYPE